MEEGSEMPTLNEVFSRLDEWRLLPQYQLERRADIFFSFYLVEALNKLDGVRVREPLIPEFPVLNKRVDEDANDFRSFKIDYLALSSDGSSAVFVELKTEGQSRRTKQDE